MRFVDPSGYTSTSANIIVITSQSDIKRFLNFLNNNWHNINSIWNYISDNNIGTNVGTGGYSNNSLTFQIQFFGVLAGGSIVDPVRWIGYDIFINGNLSYTQYFKGRFHIWDNPKSSNYSDWYTNKEEIGYYIDVKRVAETPNSTFGELYAYGPPPLKPVSLFVIEPKGPSTYIRDQNRRIPAGTYKVEQHRSRRFPNHFIISNPFVNKNRGILFHGGVTYENSSGCLIVGTSYSYTNGEYSVYHSDIAMDQLRYLLGTNTTILRVTDNLP